MKLANVSLRKLNCVFYAGTREGRRGRRKSREQAAGRADRWRSPEQLKRGLSRGASQLVEDRKKNEQ